MHQWYVSSYLLAGNSTRSAGAGFPYELVSYRDTQNTSTFKRIIIINNNNISKRLAFWFWCDFFNNTQSIDNKRV